MHESAAPATAYATRCKGKSSLRNVLQKVDGHEGAVLGSSVEVDASSERQRKDECQNHSVLHGKCEGMREKS